jgi:uncharacterized protein (UPF0333 family)
MKKQYKYLIAMLVIVIIGVGAYLIAKNSSQKNKVVEKTPFGVTQEAVFFYPSISSDNKPQFYDDITLAVGNTSRSTDDERRIKKASIENIKILKEPKAIKSIDVFKPTNDPQNPFSTDQKYNITNAKRYDITVIPENANLKFIPDSIAELGGIVHLYYYNYNFKPVTYTSGQTFDFAAAMKELGISNDDLKAKISFDLQITNKKDQTFVKHFEFNLPVSDINNKNTFSSSKLYDVDKNMFIKK